MAQAPSVLCQWLISNLLYHSEELWGQSELVAEIVCDPGSSSRPFTRAVEFAVAPPTQRSISQAVFLGTHPLLHHFFILFGQIAIKQQLVPCGKKEDKKERKDFSTFTERWRWPRSQTRKTESEERAALPAWTWEASFSISMYEHEDRPGDKRKRRRRGKMGST